LDFGAEVAVVGNKLRFVGPLFGDDVEQNAAALAIFQQAVAIIDGATSVHFLDVVCERADVQFSILMDAAVGLAGPRLIEAHRVMPARPDVFGLM
jgi:hypothetical protein